MYAWECRVFVKTPFGVGLKGHKQVTQITCLRVEGYHRHVGGSRQEWVPVDGNAMWLWLKKPVPQWNPAKWKHGPKPA